MLTVLLGKSASGKDSVCAELVEKYGFKRIVTYTTRPKRKGEIDGVDYHFVDNKTFLEMVKAGCFLEYRTYQATYGDVSYGSAIHDYQTHDNAIIILSPSGLREIKEKMQDKPIQIRSVYLKTDDITLIHRLEKRGDSKEEILRRLNCDKEDFKGLESDVDHIVLNGGSKTISELAKYIAAIVV